MVNGNDVRRGGAVHSFSFGDCLIDVYRASFFRAQDFLNRLKEISKIGGAVLTEFNLKLLQFEVFLIYIFSYETL
jgi:hypothetical protein